MKKLLSLLLVICLLFCSSVGVFADTPQSNIKVVKDKKGNIAYAIAAPDVNGLVKTGSGNGHIIVQSLSTGTILLYVDRQGMDQINAMIRIGLGADAIGAGILIAAGYVATGPATAVALAIGGYLEIQAGFLEYQLSNPNVVYAVTYIKL